ncbi:MAG: AraC family transcriptional regulator [Firmicutes bacterium]|nr:AraC family transcriptional regulator [Bacillota bacterium]
MVTKTFFSKNINSYFFHVFYRLIALSVCIIIVLSSLLYGIFKSSSIKRINKSNEQFISQISYSLKNINSYSTTYAASLMNNNHAQLLMYNENAPTTEVLSSISSLNNTQQSLPFVHSIYLYNGRLDRYYCISSHSIIRDNSFFDTDIPGMLFEEKHNFGINPIPRKMPASDYEPTKLINVYSYIIKENFPDSDNLKNALVVNINADYIFNTVVSLPLNVLLLSNNKHQCAIINSEGITIGGSEHFEFAQNVSDIKYVEKIMQSGLPSGHFIHKDGKSKSMVTYAKLDFPQWTVISATPYNFITDYSKEIRILVFLISIVILITSFITSMFLSKGIYQPVNLLKHKVENIAEEIWDIQNADSANELSYISNKFELVTTKIKKLEKFKDQNIDFIKRDFIKALLVENYYNNANSDGSNYNLNLKQDQPMYIFMLKIDNYAEFCNNYNDVDRLMLKYGLLNITNEITAAQFVCECIDMENDQIVVILNTSVENDEKFVLTSLQHIIKQIQDAMIKYFEISLSAFISNRCNELKDLPYEYNFVSELSNYRIIHGHKCILTYKDINNDTIQNLDAAINKIDRFFDLLKTGKLNEIESHCNEIIKSLHKYDYTNIIFILNYFSSALFIALNFLESSSMVVFEINFLDFNTRINSYETLDDISNDFLELLRHIVSTINENKNKKTEITIRKITTFINENYKDSNLSLVMLSDIFRISPGHLAKIFRIYTTQSVADYIKDVRLSKAKELLETTNLTINEILDQISWENKKYFFSVFKKSFGTTPSTYRRKKVIFSEDVDGAAKKDDLQL